MRWPFDPKALLLLGALAIPWLASAQSQSEEIAPLPTAISSDEMQFLSQWNATPVPPQPRSRERRRLPRPAFPLTSEELSYRDAVQKLGVDNHRFVHCELAGGKVRTGVITAIRDDGFQLKDGIIISQWIPFTDLTASPRPVPAVGTRIAHGLKWTGVVLGVIAFLPLFPLAFLVWDGC